MLSFESGCVKGLHGWEGHTAMQSQKTLTPFKRILTFSSVPLKQLMKNVI